MIEKFANSFPLFPKALINKFASVIAYALPDSELYLAAKNIYERETQKTYSQIVRAYWLMAWDTQFSVNLMQPTNSRYIETVNTEQRYIEIPVNIAIGTTENAAAFTQSDSSYYTRMRPYIRTSYDRRLYSSISQKISYKFYSVGQPFHLSYLSFMSYDSALVTPGYSDIYASVSGTPKAFNGIESILALYENGVTLRNVDYPTLYEFFTYVNAYKNYEAELQADTNLLMQQANATVNDYRQKLEDQAAREFSDLQSKKIQLLIAIDNESKSAQRDYQNMLINAQSLKQQLGGALGN